MRTRPVAAAAVLLLAACDLSAEIEVPHVGVTLPSQYFPASDTGNVAYWCAAVQTNPPCIATTLDYDLGAQVPALTNDAVSYDLRLTDAAITLSAASAGTDLSGVKSVVVSIADGSGTVIASYARPTTGAVSPGAISVAGNANVDVGPYLDAGKLPIRVALVIDGATPDFYADVQAGFSIVMKVDWGQYL